MKNFFKLTSCTILVIIFSFNLIMPIAHAADKDLKNTTFEVQKYLKLGGDDQKMEYFENKTRSPIVNFAIEIIDFLTRIIGTLAMLMFIIAGFMFIVGQGTQQQIDNAKEIFKYSIFGLLITFFSYTIVLLLQTIFAQA